MPEVFINYRTGDGEKTAALIDHALSQRFGADHIFRCTRSLAPGKRFTDELLPQVRRSALLLAVIGPEWIHSAGLHHPDDWVRQEILAAFDCGLPVLPIMEGRKTERLRSSDLPPELARLGEVQSMRLDMQNSEADLARIGDQAADLVPALSAADRTGRADRKPARSRPVGNSAEEVHGTVVQSRDITGDVTTGGASTVVENSSGPVHTGKGDIYQNSRHVSGGRHYTGDGMANIEGDNHGGIQHTFGGSRAREDNDR
ncbi:toll/interleukin-1 receptor domain-containing protein [Streptomyces sp. ACA25]|uniref:toll/interleukin-1 receptor domain-containing protein n=1 Tax=Streptomyces sp. ACA25 TaxID=3022596 RepID=UPI0023082941|nr:toll/interleukin-1 receptor domain-containing protein [Streptomyces sp. ACA25]MDB1086565.1 toll/interleukin-1 receptor domain-containing protein [Streptomyces sp. ACA25]